MNAIEKILQSLNFSQSNILSQSNSFVPYLYIDGHRSSGISDSDVECYKSGIDFFIRFASVMKELGFKEMVTMVHTKRNKAVAGRVYAIQKAIQEGLDFSNKTVADSKFKIYGDLDEYLNNGSRSFYGYLTNVAAKTSHNKNFTHHVLINYSEEWAISNISAINNLPEISSVIRFTKGFASGGWIPLKMQKTTFVYSQIPSVSEFWSDEAIAALILITFKNWISVEEFIGTKCYSSGEREVTHTRRDLELSFKTIHLKLNSPLKNRILSFENDGPVVYEF